MGRSRPRYSFKFPFLITFSLLVFLGSGPARTEVFSAEDAQNVRSAYSAVMSPTDQWIAYTVSVQREPGDEPGGAYAELHLVSPKTGELRPFITGEVNISSPLWSPDGSKIAFLTRRGEKAETQVWMIAVDGGEAVPVTSSETGVSSFRWHPSGDRIAYIATCPESAREKDLREKGYGFIYYEEDLKHRNLYMIRVGDKGGVGDPERLTEGITVWSLEFSPDGTRIALAASPENLVDHNYMFEKIHILDVDTKKLVRLTDNPGKLGNYAWSPDGSRIVYGAALELKDHAASQAYVIDAGGGEAVNLTEPGFKGHIEWVGWKDRETIVYMAGEGAWSTLSLVGASGGGRKIILDARKTGFVFRAPSFTKDFEHFALVGSSWDIPSDIYYWRFGSNEPKRLTTLNPWIAERELGKQGVVRYTARDGLEIEGILVYPVGHEEGSRYPLIISVHGGPESHRSNAWLTSYFNPAQVLAGKEYAVFYPNYRASTGYGVEFALQGYEDAAGREFDDLADAIDFLVEKGIADPERVGLGGGSYGGFAAAWFASYYTKYVRAVCMFVGISDLISKRGTTDIPYEELYVHSGRRLEETWQRSLERSPIYWAHQSKTAVLIIGGADDPRVHPSQSLEFYRRLKMNDHPAVRLVQYPGEGHGNRKQPGRIDVLYRHLQWYDWYVKDKKPLDGPMPSLDISEYYGIELPEEESIQTEGK
jgi:dipeptidyl aminopeptidase/acylaminoacyl peptidase